MPFSECVFFCVTQKKVQSGFKLKTCLQKERGSVQQQQRQISDVQRSSKSSQAADSDAPPQDLQRNAGRKVQTMSAGHRARRKTRGHCPTSESGARDPAMLRFRTVEHVDQMLNTQMHV